MSAHEYSSNHIQNNEYDDKASFVKDKPTQPKRNLQDKYKVDRSLDSEVLQKLEQIFESYKSGNDDGTVTNNTTELVESLSQFLAKNYPLQVIQLWNYYSNVNDHGKVTDSTLKLSKLLHFCNKYPVLHEPALKFIRSNLLIPANLRVFYRGLSSMKPPTTNPLLRLLFEVISFKNGELIDEFVQLFDLNLPVLSKLLTPTKAEMSAGVRLGPRSIRYNFVKFWITLFDLANPLTRKDLLSLEGSNSRKVNANLFKFCAKYDPHDLIVKCLEVWDRKILDDPVLAKFKPIKLKYLNQWNITALLPLYYVSEESINEKFDTLLNKFLIDDKAGIFIHDDRIWFNEPVMSISNDSGNLQTITVGGKKFKIINQFIYNILIELKPWDSKLQLLTTTNVLNKIPELISVYVTYLSSINNNFDPKMTFYWVGQTLLLQKIISLPIPSQIIDLHNSDDSPLLRPSNSIVMESVLPSCLNSESLGKCLKSNSFLVKQLALQLLAFSFEKLEKVIKLYEANGWNEELLKLKTRYHKSLPEIHVVLQVFRDIEKVQKESSEATRDFKLLIISLVKILNYYLIHIPNVNLHQNSLASLSSYFNTLLSSTSDFSGMDLLLLDSFFKLQELANSQSEDGSSVKVSQKWYSFSENNNSLFTNLLKLCCYVDDEKNTIDSKVISLLNSLFTQTLSFHSYGDDSNDVLTQQTFPLVSSLKFIAKIASSKESMGSIWKLLDQTVSRIMTPYKYIDLSNAKYSKISPFIVTLFEQFQYLDKSSNYDLALVWLTIFVKYLIIIGEPADGIARLFNDFVKEGKDKTIAIFTEQLGFKQTVEKIVDEFSIIESESANGILNGQLSFFESILNEETKSLSSVKEVLVNDFDLVGLLYKLSEEMENGSTFSYGSNIISKISNYLTYNTANDHAFLIVRKFLFNSKRHSEHLYEVFGNILQELDVASDKPNPEFLKLLASFSGYVRELLSQSLETPSVFVKKNLWVLDTTSLMMALMKSTNPSVASLIFMEVVSRGIHLTSAQLLHLLQQGNSFQKGQHANDITFLIINLIDNNKILWNNEDFENIINELLPSASYKEILKLIIDTNPEFSKFVVTYVNNKHSDDYDLFKFVVSSTPQDIIDECLESSDDFSNILSKIAGSLVPLNDDKIVSYDQTLKLVSNCFNFFNDEQRLSLVEFFISGSCGKDIFTGSAVSFIIRMLSAPSLDINNLFGMYLNKCFLFINKKFAETSEFTLSFQKFLTSFTKLIDSREINIHKLVRKNLINTQLEIVLNSKSWINDKIILDYIVKVISNIQRTKNAGAGFEHGRFLQIFLNNEKTPLFMPVSSDIHLNEMKFLSSLIVHKLFGMNPAKNSTISIREKILLAYTGSIASFDLLLFDILNKIEQTLSESWLNNYVINWEFQSETSNGQNSGDDYQELLNQQRLLVKENNGSMTISLSNQFLKDSIDNFVIDPLDVAPILGQQKGLAEIFEDYEIKRNNKTLVYDPRFVMLLIMNNTELLFFDENDQTIPIFDLRLLVDSNILEYLIVCLSSTDGSVIKIAQTILYNIAESANRESTTYRDKDLVKILIMKIVSSFGPDANGEIVSAGAFNPIIYYQLSRFVPIITNPSHFLYEKAYKYLLGMPSLSKGDLPLFKSITAIEDPGVFHMETIWLLNSIIGGIRTARDVGFLRAKGIIDWVFTLKNSPYLNYRIKKLLTEVISKIQDMDGCADSLITKHGLLSSLEIDKRFTEQNIAVGINKKQYLIGSQTLVDIRELNVKNALIIKNNKRLGDWSKDNVDRLIKRVCL
ncbi:Urb1 protein [Saccharomycopsis crataegensis]|uniref:Urb1 protein n=1 Tax=Saccharomycopsis crataegensis TaxID=43959 RepID=A0AAV5QNH0_9ASCO|nr:Urb1 protein [Saccharomycopsis crataegensis]